MIEEKTASAKTLEAAKLASSDELTMHVKVYSPFKTYFDDICRSVSAKNATGPFDILPRHHNFITLVQPGELVLDSLSRGVIKIKIAGGLMHIKADQVVVFLDI